MPGDDPLEKDSPPEKETPGEKSPPEKDGIQELRAEFRSALKNMDQNLGAAFGQIQQSLKAQKTPEDKGESPQKKTETPSGDDLLDELVNNPSGTIAKEVRKQLQAIAPWMLEQINDKHTDLLGRHQADFDEMYGPGAFDKFIGPELEELQLTPEMKSSRQSMTELINTLKGRKMEDLWKTRNEWETKKAEMEKEKDQQVPVMLSGGMQAPKKGKLTPSEEKFVQAYTQRYGKDLDVKELTEFRDKMPQQEMMTLSDYLQMTETK